MKPLLKKTIEFGSFLLSALVMLLLVYCKKQEVVPVKECKEQNDSVLLCYRCYGIKEYKEAVVVINNVRVYNKTNDYNFKVKKGDLIHFSFSGIATWNQKCDFALWYNDKELPSESIYFFQPTFEQVDNSKTNKYVEIKSWMKLD